MEGSGVPIHPSFGWLVPVVVGGGEVEDIIGSFEFGIVYRVLWM
jgi:hypothetical protein